MDRPWGTAFAAWLAGVGAFQTALALGAPGGAAAWGGAHPGVLPGRLRAASAAGAVAWVGAATVAAGVLGGETARRQVLRAATGFAGLSVLLNAASPSRIEPALWVPLTAVGAALGVSVLRETPADAEWRGAALPPAGTVTSTSWRARSRPYHYRSAAGAGPIGGVGKVRLARPALVVGT